MYKTTVGVDGMMCSMCESHINDSIRNAFPGAKKVKANRHKKNTVFLTEEPVDEEKVKKTIEDTGYHFTGVTSEPYEKKSLFG